MRNESAGHNETCSRAPEDLGAALRCTAIGTCRVMTAASPYRRGACEIEEASKIDGANDAQMIWRIVLPLAKPAIVVTCVMVLITVWNEFFKPEGENTLFSLLLNLMRLEVLS